MVLRKVSRNHMVPGTLRAGRRLHHPSGMRRRRLRALPLEHRTTTSTAAPRDDRDAPGRDWRELAVDRPRVGIQ